MNNRTTELPAIAARVSDFIRSPGSRSESRFNELALEIFRFQYAHNRPYRAFCDRSGKPPEKVAVWPDVPAMVTRAFKDLDVTVLPAEERTAVFHSSGTTEQRPSRHFHNAQTLAIYEKSLLAGFRANVLPDLESAQFLLLSPPPGAAPRSSLAHMFASVSELWGQAGRHFTGSVSGDGSWKLDFDALAELTPRLKSSRMPVVICGTAFSFVHWCDHLAALGQQLTFPPRSRIFETGGYKGRSRALGKPELHAMIEHSLGISQDFIVSEYGMSEISSQGYDRVAGTSAPREMRFSDWAQTRLISPETMREVEDGEVGLVRIYDLANIGSALAIQTEDLAIRRGAGFELLGRAALAEPRGCSLLAANP